MAPYTAPFAPTASSQIIRRDSTNAFVDVNGDGSYLAGTDCDVALSGWTITASRTVAPGTVESQATGCRLIVQNSLFKNPDAVTNYPVQATLAPSCGSWSASLGESFSPPDACRPTMPVADTLTVTKSGSCLILSWLSSGDQPSGCRVRYAVLASDNPAPTGGWTDITGQNLDMSPAAKSFRSGLGIGLTYYLVAGLGPNGEVGPTAP